MSRDVTTLPPGQPGTERRLRAVPDAPGPRAAGPRRTRAARPSAAGDAGTAPPAPADGSSGTRTAGLRQSRGTRPGDPAGLRQRPGARPGDPAALRQRPGPPGTRAPARPGTRPSRAPAGQRPGRAPAAARPAVAGQESRTRFVFLVLGLLAGALISLLLINTVLATGSYEITALQKANVQLAQQRQVLAAQIASEQTPAVLYRRARQLGMVDPPLTHFLDLRKGRIVSQPHRVPGVVVYPPGYTP